MGKFVIIDSISGDVLSVPMELGECNQIANWERDLAAEDGRPCPLAVVEAGWGARQSQEAARRRMSGNPPRTAIIYDEPMRTEAQETALAAAREPVGLEEIAARLGRPRPTVDQWRNRGVLPEPWYTVGGRPAWPWHVIEKWARETGRLANGTQGEPSS